MTARGWRHPLKLLRAAFCSVPNTIIERREQSWASAPSCHCSIVAVEYKLDSARPFTLQLFIHARAVKHKLDLVKNIFVEKSDTA